MLIREVCSRTMTSESTEKISINPEQEGQHISHIHLFTKKKSQENTQDCKHDTIGVIMSNLINFYLYLSPSELS